MEIDQAHFKKELLPILKHIANSSFVSFDLEMSGIHKNSRFGPRAVGHDNGKPSLQQLYEETKTAAETFQVLQVGITFVEEDREKGESPSKPLAKLAGSSLLRGWQELIWFLPRVLSCTPLQLQPQPAFLSR
jgi:poly(A)-specific ribonuclease